MARHRLFVIRHAKSQWPAGIPDEDRPISDRGRRNAAVAAKWLAEQDQINRALVSPAKRTRQTWDLLGESLENPVETEVNDAIYEARWSDLASLITELPESVEVAATIGHNPGTERLVDELAGPDSDPDALAVLHTKYPTLGIAVLDFETPWAEISRSSGRLVEFVIPRHRAK